MVRVGGLAALVQLRVCLEDAEQFVAVGNDLALQDAAARGAADLTGALCEGLQLGEQGEDIQVGAALECLLLQAPGAVQQ